MSIRSSIEEFEDLQLKMGEFSVEIERKLTEKRAQLIKDKQDHYIKVNELRGQEMKLHNDISNLQTKESKTKENLNLSIEALQAQRFKVDELVRSEEELIEQKNELQLQIAELNKIVESTTDDLTRSQISLENQIKRDYPELVKYEIYLGLKIEAIATDLIRFVFSNIDPINSNREFWVELSVGTDTYQVGKSNPELNPETTQLLQQEFNTHQELVRFLKSTRNIFRDLV